MIYNTFNQNTVTTCIFRVNVKRKLLVLEYCNCRQSHFGGSFDRLPRFASTARQFKDGAGILPAIIVNIANELALVFHFAVLYLSLCLCS